MSISCFFNKHGRLTMDKIVLLMLFFALAGKISASAVTGEDLYNVILDDHRDGTVVLDCAAIRTGTITLRSRSCDFEDFFVNFRVKYGHHCRGYFRFYLSIRQHLLGAPKVTVFDSMYNERAGHRLGTSYLKKSGPSPDDYIPVFPNVTHFIQDYIPDIPVLGPKLLSSHEMYSFGQYLSNRDSIRIEVAKDVDCKTQLNEGFSQALIDFTLVQADRKPAQRNPGWERYCPALRGFIPQEIMCAENRRVTCPDIFTWARGFFDIPNNLRTLRMCRDNVIPTPEPSSGATAHEDDNFQVDENQFNPFRVNVNIDIESGSQQAEEGNSHQKDRNQEDCWNNPLNPHSPECHKPPSKRNKDDEEEDEDDNHGQQPQQDDHVTRRPRHKRRWTPRPDFDDDFDLQERNEEDNYTRRPRGHHRNRFWKPWSIAFVTMGIILAFFVLPALACCWCMRRRDRVVYKTLVTQQQPTAPFYGTFDDPYQQQQTHSSFRSPPPQVIMVPPPYNQYAATGAKLLPPL